MNMKIKDALIISAVFTVGIFVGTNIAYRNAALTLKDRYIDLLKEKLERPIEGEKDNG